MGGKEGRGSGGKGETKGALPSRADEKRPMAGMEMYKVAPASVSQSSSFPFDREMHRSSASSTSKPCSDDSLPDLKPGLPAELQNIALECSEEFCDYPPDQVPIAFGGRSTLPTLPINSSHSSTPAPAISQSPQVYKPPKKLSTTQSSKRNMADSRQSSTSKLLEEISLNADASFKVHGSQEFYPGCVVKLIWYDDSELNLSDNEDISDDEFIRRRRARKGKVRLFVLFKTFPDYSMAVPIYTYRSEALVKAEYNLKYHAMVYTSKGVPPLRPGAKQPSNPPIRLELTEELTEELPPTSRLNYAAVFTIEHSFPLAFVGRIAKLHWNMFASSYANVQSTVTGDDIEPPSAERQAGCNPDAPPSPQLCDELCDSYVPPYDGAEATWAGSGIVQEAYSGAESQSEYTYSKPDPPFPLPPQQDRMQSQQSSPPSDGSTTSPSGGAGDSSTQAGTSSGSSAGGNYGVFGSETPIRLFHAGQTRYGPLAVEYAQIAALETLRLDNFPKQSMALQVFAGAERIAEQKSLDWIADINQSRRAMMRSIEQQQGQSIENMCDELSPPRSDLFQPSRVRVAILDSAANVYSSVFAPFPHRIKGFYDFIEDGQRPVFATHGLHVAALLLHMSPYIDLYFARVLGGRDVSQGAAPMTKAIRHAIKEWKVDIISISGGQHNHDFDLEDALALARYRKVAIFAATHNHGKSVQQAFPARDATVVGVSSNDDQGNLSRSAAQAMENKLNFAALGENIPQFWMGSYLSSILRPLSGSSFAAPIAVGIYATTLLAARLLFRRNTGTDEELRVHLTSPAVRERLLLALSTYDCLSKYHNINPEELWSSERGYTEKEIKRHIDQILRAIPRR